jgi:hypothetical protein
VHIFPEAVKANPVLTCEGVFFIDTLDFLAANVMRFCQTTPL